MLVVVVVVVVVVGVVVVVVVVVVVAVVVVVVVDVGTGQGATLDRGYDPKDPPAAHPDPRRNAFRKLQLRRLPTAKRHHHS